MVGNSAELTVVSLVADLASKMVDQKGDYSAAMKG
jgi:hypothetical protein